VAARYEAVAQRLLAAHPSRVPVAAVSV
jgi:hypothetical protein